MSMLSFLFENKGTHQTILKNTFWLALGRGISQLVTFVLSIYIIRTFGPLEFGKFSFALSAASFFLLFSDLGVSDIIPREFARDSKKEREYPALLTLRSFLTFGTFFLIAASAFFITKEHETRILMLILSIFVLSRQFYEIFFAFFRGREKMQHETAFMILHAVLTAIAGFLVLFYSPSILNLSYAYMTSALFVLFILFIFFNFKIMSIKFSWAPDRWRHYLSISLPVGLAALIGGVYTQMDSVIMGYLGQIKEVGWYNAAYRLIGFAIMPAVIISAGFYPALSKTLNISRQKFQNLWENFFETMILLTVPMVFGGFVLAMQVIYWLYGSEYGPSIPAFKILIFVMGLHFLYSPFALMLVVIGEQKKFFYIQAGGAAVNLILNVILIPRYSLYGAAVATVVTYGLLFISALIAVKQFAKVSVLSAKLLRFTFLVITASIFMIFIIKVPALAQFHILFQILVGAASYFTFIIIFYKLNPFTLKPHGRK